LRGCRLRLGELRRLAFLCDMKSSIFTTIFILVLGSVIFGQNIIATTENGDTVILKPNKTWEYAVKTKPAATSLTEGWAFITEARDDIYGARYYYQPRNVKTDILGQKETWLRIIPKVPEKYNRKYKLPLKTSYIKQFLSMDCRNERYSLEQAVFYNAEGDILGSNRFWNGAGFEKIVPNTVTEVWKKELCD
jgi:hypothetical protein